MEAERRKRILIVAVLLCVGVWVADSMVFTPLYNLWTTRSTRIEDLRQEIAKSSGLLDRRPELKKRWEDMKKRALPNRESDAEKMVFESVSRWADESSLKVNSVKPSWSHPKKEAETLKIELEGVGGMESVVKFVYALECGPLPLRVEDMEISSQDKEGTTLKLNLRFSGLVLERMSPR
jgi:Tfp pilus assembly protein PilO